MKEKILILFLAVSIACVPAGLAQPKPSATYDASLVIVPSENTKKPMLAISAVSSFDKIFPQPDNNRRLLISSAKLESGDPSTRLAMFKSVKIYLAMGDGSNQVLIASSTGISQNAGSSLTLNLNRSVSNDNSVNFDKIDPTASIEQALLGRLAGVQVLPSGDVRIRGVNNLAGGPPLYIIDGVERNSLQGLNPGDVESIEVLKDVSQLAMYGMRGANGVIRVKTKSGDTNSKRNAGSIDKFVAGSAMCVRLEYVLRYPVKEETMLNVSVNFK